MEGKGELRIAEGALRRLLCPNLSPIQDRRHHHRSSGELLEVRLSWRARAKRAKAQAPEDAPAGGRVRDPDERADRAGREESVGAGDLGKDRGEGGDGEGKE